MVPLNETVQTEQMNQTAVSDHTPLRREQSSPSNQRRARSFGQNQFVEQFFGRQYGRQDPFQCSRRCSDIFMSCWQHVAFGGSYGNKSFEVCNEQQTKCNNKCF